MEEGILAFGASKDAAPVRVNARQLHQLSSVALNSGLLGTSEVGTTSSIDTYFLILDMNGLLLEMRPSLNGRDRVYSFREDVGEFLEFCMKNFEVVFWSCYNGRYYHASGERRAVIWRAVSDEKPIIVKNISYFRNYF